MSAAVIDFPALSCRPAFRQALLKMISAAHDAMRGADADLAAVAAVAAARHPCRHPHPAGARLGDGG